MKPNFCDERVKKVVMAILNNTECLFLGLEFWLSNISHCSQIADEHSYSDYNSEGFALISPS
jgi:hypothetical protein